MCSSKSAAPSAGTTSSKGKQKGKDKQAVDVNAVLRDVKLVPTFEHVGSEAAEAMLQQVVDFIGATQSFAKLAPTLVHCNCKLPVDHPLHHRCNSRSVRMQPMHKTGTMSLWL